MMTEQAQQPQPVIHPIQEPGPPDIDSLWTKTAPWTIEEGRAIVARERQKRENYRKEKTKTKTTKAPGEAAKAAGQITRRRKTKASKESTQGSFQIDSEGDHPAPRDDRE